MDLFNWYIIIGILICLLHNGVGPSVHQLKITKKYPCKPSYVGAKVWQTRNHKET